LSPLDRPEQSLIYSARPYIGNERRIVDGYEIFIEQAMYHTVANTRDGDAPFFIVHDVKDPVPAVPIQIVVKFIGKAK